MRALLAGLVLVAGVASAEVVVLDVEFGDSVTGRDRDSYSMTIRNDGDYAIGALGYQHAFTTPGRQHPWADERGFIFLPGGLEPGETRTIKAIGAPREMILAEGYEVEIEIYDKEPRGAGGEPLP